MAASKTNRFVPTFEALESREVATATPISASAPLLDQAHVGEFQTDAQVVVNTGAPQGLAGAPTAAASMATDLTDPLVSYHRTYLGLKDLRKGDILLNTTDATLSKWIREVTKSNYNHAAIYVGAGKVVEAVSGGVREIDLMKYLNDNYIVRVMVLRNENLSTAQKDAVANFARSKVGARYNVGGLIGGAVDFKPSNYHAFDRSDYFCSQLVAAAYSSAGAALHLSLEQTPGNLADMINRINIPQSFLPKLTALGALYDGGFHQSVREGRECLNLDLTAPEQQYLVNALSTRLNRNGGNYSVQLERLTADSTGKVLAEFTVTRPGMGNFKVTYNISGGTDANINVTSPRPSKEFDHANSHIGESLKRVMMTMRRTFQLKYFGDRASAPQIAGVFEAGHDNARHVAAVDAVFAGFSKKVWAA